MRKSALYVLLLLAGSMANAAVNTEFLPGLGNTHYHRVSSDVIGRSYHIYVMLPFIEGSYRSRSDRRVIFGQSIGGQFVLYTALTEPNLFWGHIASNPALHRNLPFFLKEHAESAPAGERSRLFVASGTNDDPGFRGPAQEWVEHWSGIGNAPWQLKFTNLDGHSHMSAPPASFRQGMRWLFSTD